jgi:hypothetical protein
MAPKDSRFADVGRLASHDADTVEAVAREAGEDDGVDRVRVGPAGARQGQEPGEAND